MWAIDVVGAAVTVRVEVSGWWTVQQFVLGLTHVGIWLGLSHLCLSEGKALRHGVVSAVISTVWAVCLFQVRYLSDYFDLCCSIVHDYRSKVWVLPLGTHRVLVFDDLWLIIIFLTSKLQVEWLLIAILFVDTGCKVDQATDFLLASLIPSRAHHQRLLWNFVCLVGDGVDCFLPTFSPLLAIDQTDGLTRIAAG